jgi:hypothetical protein
MTNGILALLQAAQATPAQHPSGFWEQNRNTILVGILMFVLTLLLSDPIKAVGKKLGERVENAFAGLGLRFRKRYLAALADGHRWLKLIGVYNSTDLHSPRLQEVYVSLRLAATRGDDGPRFGWSEIFAPC